MKGIRSKLYTESFNGKFPSGDSYEKNDDSHGHLSCDNDHCNNSRREFIVLAAGQVTLRLNEIFLVLG